MPNPTFVSSVRLRKTFKLMLDQHTRFGTSQPPSLLFAYKLQAEGEYTGRNHPPSTRGAIKIIASVSRISIALSLLYLLALLSRDMCRHVSDLLSASLHLERTTKWLIPKTDRFIIERHVDIATIQPSTIPLTPCCCGTTSSSATTNTAGQIATQLDSST